MPPFAKRNSFCRWLDRGIFRQCISFVNLLCAVLPFGKTSSISCANSEQTRVLELRLYNLSLSEPGSKRLISSDINIWNNFCTFFFDVRILDGCDCLCISPWASFTEKLLKQAVFSACWARFNVHLNIELSFAEKDVTLAPLSIVCSPRWSIVVRNA